MKEIINWVNATTFDTESDALLDEATKLHVLSYHMQNGRSKSIKGNDDDTIKKFFQWHIQNKIPVVAHNSIRHDTPLIEKLFDINLDELMVIDTLALSWYLNMDREQHGLDTFFEDYGIAKPKVDDWENLSYEEYAHRCEEDVKINVALWEDFKARLVDMYSKSKFLIDSGKVNPKRMSKDEVTYLDQYVNSSSVEEYINRILTFLMFKMDCARLQEKTRWKVDENYLKDTFEFLDQKVKETLSTLEAVMPPVPKYGTRKKPDDPLKKDGTLKQQAIKWNEAVSRIGEKDQWGNDVVKIIEGDDHNIQVISKYESPNANSPDQLKKFFFRHGWKPDVYKYVKDKEATQKWADGGFKKEEKPIPRRIPQINKEGEDGKELCDSLLKLAEEIPEIEAYNGYSVAKHRYDVINGFMRDLKDGHLQARIGGFTNCLTADSVIITNRGALLIGQVRSGDKVLTHEGVYKDVIDTIDNGIKDVFRVSLEDGREIKCTYNHKFWDGQQWVMAKDLEVGKHIKVYGDIERWKEIEGSVGYKVSSWGRIMNQQGLILTPNQEGGKFTYSVELDWQDGKRRNSIISRLVLDAFIGHSELHALHKDGNPYNNNLQNLYYGTDSDNMKDTKLHGKHLKSVRNKKNSRLTHKDIDEIQRLLKLGHTGKELAEKFGVSTSMISMVKNGRRWSSDLNEDSLYVEEFSDGVVKNVSYVSTEPTFDISVEGVHSYVANGFVVHNTLRVCHREIVNLVGVDKPYGENVRGSLTCEDDEILLGSDLSSLEDRTKHHYMLPHDPDYVATMTASDYDPHILTALSAGLITEKEMIEYKSGHKEEHVVKARKAGKSTNYACLPISSTMVKTKGGYKYIDEVNEGDKILGYDKGRKYIDVLDTDLLISQDLYRVNIGGDTFLCSKEHAWVVKNGFKHSDDLEVGDKVFTGYSWETFNGIGNTGIKDTVACVHTSTNNFFIYQNGVEILTGNCVYGGSPEAISRSAGVDLPTAKKLHKGYWDLNWSVKVIAEEQCVFKDARGNSWLINPLNGYCYSLRTEKDRFSTLAQGTGSFFFDMWVDRILNQQMKFFKTKKLTGSFHKQHCGFNEKSLSNNSSNSGKAVKC